MINEQSRVVAVGSALSLCLVALGPAVRSGHEGATVARQGAGSDLPQLCVDDTGALAATGLEAGDSFGRSVGLDGDLALVGADQDDDKGQGSGSARVFTRQGGEWVESAKLLAGDGAAAQHFGVAAAASGATLVVGASAAHAPQVFFSGAVYVFGHDGAQWTEEVKITDKEPLGADLFGAAVDLDGDVLAVGVPGDDDVVLNAGTAQVFVREATGWTLRAKLKDDGAAIGDVFGSSVTTDAGTVAVGAPGSAAERGAAFVHVQQGLNWPFQAKLVASGARVGDRFGASMSLDGDTLAIGAPFASAAGGHGGGEGAVYVYTRVGGSWTEQARLVAKNGKPGEHFGAALALEGDRLIVGAPGADAGRGTAYAFLRQGSTWGPHYRIDPPGVDAGENWGADVALAGGALLIASPGDAGTGGVRTYATGNALSMYCTAKPNSLACPPRIDYRGCPRASADSGFVVLCNNTLNQRAGMLLYSVAGRAAVPFQDGTLCVASPVGRSPARSSGGPPKTVKTCTGAYRIDMNAFAAGALGGEPDPTLRLPGTLVTCQWWAREPFLAPHPTVLSNALEYQVGP